VGPAAQCGAHGQIQFKLSLNYLKQFQINSNLFCSKHDLHELKFFEIKYGFEGFDRRNNFPYRKFSRFKVDFE
jgi:hypothetical protein